MIVYLLACTCVLASEEEYARNREIRLSPHAISVTAEYPQPYGKTTVTATTWQTNGELKIQSLTFASQCVTCTIPSQLISDLNRPQLNNIELTYSLGMRSGKSNIYASVTIPFGEAQTNATHQYQRRTFCIVGEKIEFIANDKPKDNWYETEIVKIQASQPAKAPVHTGDGNSKTLLMPEAQCILDDLNSWNKDAVDVQEFHHASDTGETTAYINDAKAQLARLGIKIQWNHAKRIFEVVK